MKKIRLFRPVLAGATWPDRVATCFGAAFGLALIGLGGFLSSEAGWSEAWIVAPIGASAVLLFAVPASPLTQPWPVIGGSIVSAIAGVAAGTLIGNDAVAVGLAVGLAIAAMSLTGTLHPPGGAVAITSVVAVSTGGGSHLLFPLAPIGIEAAAIVLLAWAFHRLVTGHSYPHVPPMVIEPVNPLPGSQIEFGKSDVDAVLARMDDAFDISREDLEAILHAVESEALARATR